jgi:ribonucleotide monophosphatase NagD (HAD superfamily)
MTIFEKHLKLVYKLKMNPLKAVLIDLSGTIHIDKDVIPGSIEALKKLIITIY